MCSTVLLIKSFASVIMTCNLMTAMIAATNDLKKGAGLNSKSVKDCLLSSCSVLPNDAEKQESINSSLLG